MGAHQSIADQALDAKIESAKMVRIDSTVTDSPIPTPWDSSLLGDSVRVMDRMMKEARQYCRTLSYTCHQRGVKKLMSAIRNVRGEEKRKAHYRKLIKYTRKTLSVVERVLVLGEGWGDAIAQTAWKAQATHYIPLIERIIDQAERRVIKGEQVEAEEKVVSLFEPHTDSIVKDKRAVQYKRLKDV